VSATDFDYPMTEADAPTLRDAMLAGRHSRPDITQFNEELTAFLAADKGALALWLGAALTASVRAVPERLRGLIDRDIALIDRLLSAQLDAVLHHPRFLRLEGSWRGLAWLTDRFEPSKRLKVLVLQATWRDLERDLTRAIEFDQSNVFRMIYENEFGRAGGEPIGLLVLDYEVRHRPELRKAGGAAPVDDVTVTTALSTIAAAAFVPAVIAASPALLGVDRFDDLALSSNVTALLNGSDYARWRSLVARENTRFLCLTMPRILARPRWAAHHRSLWYREHTSSIEERPWFVAGYAFAATVCRAFLAYQWPADIRGVGTDRVGGGLVLDLPADDFIFGAETRWPRAAIDFGLSDSQERELVMAGLMPLNTLPYGDAAFASAHSLQSRLPNTQGQEPTPYQANWRISAQISSMLCVSRFAHYIKIIARDLIGSNTGPADIERKLRIWLASYTNTSQRPTSDSRARHPLMSSAIQVFENPGKPGSYGCVIQLQPYYQIDDISTTFRLVTDLGSSGPVPDPV
jgi:type VI secretion system ImpC/EvpB family protein